MNTDSNATSRGSGRLWKLGLVLIAVLALLGGTAWWAASTAHARGWRHSPEDRQAFARFVVERALAHVEASDAQQAEVLAIVDGAFEEMAPLLGGHRERRDALRAELLSEVVRPEMLEELRQEQVADLEQLSRVLTRVAVEVSEVLTPEQRRDLAELHAGGRHH